jgi:hypothetical protein
MGIALRLIITGALSLAGGYAVGTKHNKIVKGTNDIFEKVKNFNFKKKVNLATNGQGPTVHD